MIDRSPDPGTKPEDDASGHDASEGRVPARDTPPVGESGSDATERVPDELVRLVAATEGLQPGRRLFHAAFGLAFAGLLVVDWPPQTALGLAAGGAALGAAGLDLLRLRHEGVNRWFFRRFRPFASPREAKGLASSTWFLVGVALTLLLFPERVALGALLVLALADPTASYLGRRWGRLPLGTGTVEGSFAFLTVALLVLVPLVGWIPGAVAAGVVTGAERVPWRFDDNLTIPLITGIVLWSLLPLG